jgi:hypothetical protein
MDQKLITISNKTILLSSFDSVAAGNFDKQINGFIINTRH